LEELWLDQWVKQESLLLCSSSLVFVLLQKPLSSGKRLTTSQVGNCLAQLFFLLDNCLAIRPLLHFRSALHCSYSGITDIQDGLFFVLPVQELLKKARARCAIANSKLFAKTFNIFIRGRYLYQ
jgi:hypothetical protein